MRRTPEETKQRYELVLKLRGEQRTFAEIGRALGVDASTARYTYQRAFAQKARTHQWKEYLKHDALQPTELKLLAKFPYVTEAATAISGLEVC